MCFRVEIFLYGQYIAMAFLYVNDEETTAKINIDELYEKKQKRDQRQLSVFNKILNRINKRITTTSQMKRDEKYIWYQVPPYIFGEPIYDQTDCIAYVVTKLAENGFINAYSKDSKRFFASSISSLSLLNCFF
jgi:hypothetical protein